MQGPFRTALGKPIPAAEYTLPLVWQRLKEGCDYAQRAQQVAAFNAASPWVKRGIAITHCRWAGSTTREGKKGHAQRV